MFNSKKLLLFTITERQQLPAISTGASPAHRLPAHLQCIVFTREQINAHRSQTREHSLRRQ